MRLLLLAWVVTLAMTPSAGQGAPPRFPTTDRAIVLADFLQLDPGISHGDRLSEDTNLAVYAFWEMRVRNDYGRVGGRGREFAAFVEGRLRIAVPKWWTKSLTRGAVFPRGDNFNRTIDEYRSLWTTKDGFTFSGPEAVTETDGTLKLSWKDRFGYVKRSDLHTDAMAPNSHPTTVVANKEPGRLYVILDDGAISFHGGELVCVDTFNGKVIWRQPLTARFGYPGGGSGNWESFSEITVENDLVTVFGGRAWGMSIAAFRARDGEPVLNFYSMLLDPGYRKAVEETSQ